MTTMETLRQVDMPVFEALMEDNPWQPRTLVDPEADAALRESIRQNDLLHPPIARLQGSKLQLAVGHRRSRACIELWKAGDWPADKPMPVDVRELTDEQMAILGLAENVDRRNLNQVEELRAFERILAEIPGMTQKKLAEATQRSQPTIANGLRVLALPTSAIASIEAGNLPLRAARELLCIVDHPEIIDDVMQETVEDDDYRTDNVVGNLHRALDRAGWVSAERHYPRPAFDVEAFAKQHKDRTYWIPGFKHSYGKMPASWWCSDRSLWNSKQAEAVKAKRAAEPDEPDLPAHPPAQLKDRVLLQIAKKAKVDVADAEGNITEAVRTAGGTRAEPAKFVENQYGAREQYLRLDRAFLDTSDCGTCTEGAVYVRSRFWNERDGVLRCANSMCFKRHLRQGKQRWEQAFLDRAVDHDAAVLEHAQALAERLTSSPVLVSLYRAMLRHITLGTDAIYVTLWDRGRPYGWDFDYAMQQRTIRISAGISRILELLEVADVDQLLADGSRYSGRIDNLVTKAIDALPDDDPRLPEIVALAVSEWALRNEGWGKAPDLSRKPKGA